jgi:NAD(P)-dependent dehydrogenase (short-subunit alcohol dehydrogenase family)
MEELEERVAVVTGAASGIGEGLARTFAAEGMRLALADIDGAALDALAGELRDAGSEVVAVATDVTRREDVERLADHAFAELGAVHVLCNNAGVCQGGPIHEMTDTDWEWLLSVNFHGMRHGCSVFVPRLLAQGQPAHVVNTASVGGFLSGGELGMYSTTKYAVVAYSEALAWDLGAHGIGVSILCPSFTRTRLGDAARNRPAALGTAPARLDAIVDGMQTGMDPLEVGRHVVRGIRENALYVFTDPDTKPFVEDRFARVLAAMDHSADPPEGS